MYNLDPYTVLLSIATNIAVLLMTAFVLQAHIYECLPNDSQRAVIIKRYWII